MEIRGYFLKFHLNELCLFFFFQRFEKKNDLSQVNWEFFFFSIYISVIFAA